MLSIKSTLDPENARPLDVEIRESLEEDSQERVVVLEPRRTIFHKELEAAKSSTKIATDSSSSFSTTALVVKTNTFVFGESYRRIRSF